MRNAKSSVALMAAFVLLPLSGSLNGRAARTDAREILIVEQRKDAAARDVMLARLAKRRASLKLEKASTAELIEALNRISGEHIAFMAWHALDAEGEEELFDLNVKSLRLLDVMSIVTKLSAMRFVYGDGVIWLKHKSKVKEETFLRIYDIRLAVAPLRSFPGPDLRLGLSGDEESSEPVEEETTNTVSGLDQGLIEQLLRKLVLPDSWDGEGGASLTAANGLLIIVQSARGHRQARRLLLQLGVN